MKFNAELIAAQINENVIALQSGDITCAQFSERNRSLWDRVAHGELNIIGSVCDRRHMEVKRELDRLMLCAQSQRFVGVPEYMRDYAIVP